MNRLKNGLILFILIGFLSFVAIMPVTCVFKTVTGIFCPACGMTRAFIAILHFNFLEACYQNLLSIPLFIFIFYSLFQIGKDFLKNRFSYIPKLLLFFEHHYLIIIVLLIISFIFNNLKP